MKVFIVILALFAVSISAKPSGGFTIHQQQQELPLTPTIYAAAPILSQYHSQDVLGQYSYGYNGGQSTKVETKTLDGVTRGSYSYIDAAGQLQTVEYTADALNGFRAAATNLPRAPIDMNIAPEPVRDTPEVAAARADHMAKFDEIANRNELSANQENIAEIDNNKSDDLPTSSSSSSAEEEQPIVADFKAAIAAPLLPTPAAPTHIFAAAPAPILAPAQFFAPGSEYPQTGFSYSFNAPLSNYAYAHNGFLPATYYRTDLPQYHHQYQPAATFATYQPSNLAYFARSALPLAAAAAPAPVAAPISFFEGMPLDTPEVAAEKQKHFAAVEEQKAKIAAASN